MKLIRLRLCVVFRISDRFENVRALFYVNLLSLFDKPIDTPAVFFFFLLLIFGVSVIVSCCIDEFVQYSNPRGGTECGNKENEQIFYCHLFCWVKHSINKNRRSRSVTMAQELPYKCEYAKSGRAGCKGCKLKIDQGALRLAVMVQVCHFPLILKTLLEYLVVLIRWMQMQHFRWTPFYGVIKWIPYRYSCRASRWMRYTNKEMNKRRKQYKELYGLICLARLCSGNYALFFLSVFGHRIEPRIFSIVEFPMKSLISSHSA